ncbi:MAG: nitroreductase [Butyrivibrio sp.]|nr:nitroreductase [Butyrivibrio sp.]
MLKDLVLANRSYRGFDESYTFSKEDMEEFIEIARLCPSAANLQPLKYYICYEQDRVEQILNCTKWAAALPELCLPREGHHPTAFIVICQDCSISSNLHSSQKDVGIAAQSILLRAAEDGLGGLMIGNFDSDALKTVLGLSDQFEIQLVIALGKPDETIKIVDVKNDGSTKYYRDKDDVHYVPKRLLKNIIINN